MSHCIVRGAVGAAVLLLAWTGAARAQGLEGLHDQRREGGRVCMADHFHDGSGSGATKRQAEAAAIRAWAEFTAWEYGGNWGSFNLAASKSVNCSGGGGSINCSVSARPCRPGR